MFNLFGSFFFGSKVEQNAATTENNNEQHMEEARVNSDASTQTLDATAQQLLMVSTHHDQEDALQKQWVIVERAKQEQQQPLEVAEASTSTHLLEDVKEEEETMPSVPEREEDDEDVLLGSFFDRNQVDDSAAKTCQVVAAVPQKDEWLITPLPCLTSITCSQRSIENDPLENLLIEHPSMSVFVTVTQSAVDEDQTQVVKPAESNVRRKEDSLTSPPVVMMTQSPSQKKRKGMESTSPQAQVPQISPASTMRRSKASKKNKKSSAVSASSQQQQQQQQSPVSCQSNQVANKENKENVMRTLEVRSKAVNSAAKLDSILLSKNQMKRNNKHAFKFNSNNCIQRKFHKLQQPVCC